MKYKFNFLFQLVFGAFGFGISLLVLYLFTREINWLSSVIAGISQFALSGFYTGGK